MFIEQSETKRVVRMNLSRRVFWSRASVHKAVGMWREHVAVVTGNQCARPPYVIWLLRRWMADMAEVGAESACDSRCVGVRLYFQLGL